MTNELLTVADHGPVRLIAMDKGVRGNTLSEAIVESLLNAVKDAERDESVKAIVLGGSERHFCVGMDLKIVAAKNAVRAVEERWLDDIDQLRQCRKPIIAAVRGYAVGGGFELALYCDLIIAAEDAQFSLPETGIGLIAGQGGSQRLVAMCGRAIATDLVLTGRSLSGREAYEFGIAARVFPSERVLEEAIEIGQTIAKRSAVAVSFAREILHEATEAPIRQSLRIERLLASVVLDTAEARQRVGDFLERRNKRS